MSAYIILSRFLSSYADGQLNAPADVLCNVDAEHLVNNYPVFFKAFKYLYKSIEGTEFYYKNLNSFRAIINRIEGAPDQLTNEQSETLLQKIQTMKHDNC